MTAYYNENDPFAVQWLRNLIAAGHIAPGIVDERSIEDVTPDDLHGFTQCHFFAGVGVWSLALRRAGWTDDKPAWTGSCPCQPFSAAGKGNGFADERHLWPAFFHLISECKPGVIFGEQVASKDGLGWLDLVQTDLEAKDYAVGAVDLCAAGFGAPHIRQRLFWVANSDIKFGNRCGSERTPGWDEYPDSSATNRLGDSKHNGFVADSLSGSLSESQNKRRLLKSERPDARTDILPISGQTNGYWRDADWLLCRDDKWRAVESGTFPLADGVAGRVAKIRAYGNAIVAPVAEEFIRAYMLITEE